MKVLDKKNLLTLSIFSLLTTGLPGLFFNSAYATSPYDNIYGSVSVLNIGAPNWSPSSCVTVDATQSWQQYLLGSYNASSMAYMDETDYNMMKASFQGALQTGRYGVTVQNSMYHEAYVYWTVDTSLALSWDLGTLTVAAYSPTSTIYTARIGCSKYYNNSKSGVGVLDWTSNTTNIPDASSGFYYVSGASNGWKNLFVYSDHYNKPENYEGNEIISAGSIDNDDDGLNLIQELQQGTSDGKKDTDGDGIDDLKESVWYGDRDDVFCKTSVTPHECAYPNPTTKDLYVEIDWMNDGTRDYKPTSGQLTRVVNAFAAQNIIAHFDTGAYGGGEELTAPTGDLFFAPTEDEVDFYDLKNGTPTSDPTFAPIRRGIWRYMITSMNYMNNISETTGLPVPGTTGSSFAGDDDSMVSIERVEALLPSYIPNPTTQDSDIAVAGTIIHELGHNLCLTYTYSYQNQSGSCFYQGIDNNSGFPPTNNPDGYFNLVSYESSMNYKYQLLKVDYSHGISDVTYDHDDWSAVTVGIDDFRSSPYEWYNNQSQRRGGQGQVNQLSRKEMIDAIQK